MLAQELVEVVDRLREPDEPQGRAHSVRRREDPVVLCGAVAALRVSHADRAHARAAQIQLRTPALGLPRQGAVAHAQHPAARALRVGRVPPAESHPEGRLTAAGEGRAPASRQHRLRDGEAEQHETAEDQGDEDTAHAAARGRVHTCRRNGSSGSSGRAGHPATYAEQPGAATPFPPVRAESGEAGNVRAHLRVDGDRGVERAQDAQEPEADALHQQVARWHGQPALGPGRGAAWVGRPAALSTPA